MPCAYGRAKGLTPRMADLHIPPFLNYSCQACGRCCRDYEIAFSEEDFRRISGPDWGAIFPALADQELFARSRGRGQAGPHRFRLKADRTCVFLDESGTCLMHRHLGERKKALACVMFPFTFAHTPSGVYVGLRFNCRAVAEGVGERLDRRRRDLEHLLKRCRREGHAAHYGERVQFDAHQEIGWDQYLAIERELINVVLRPDMELPRRLLLAWQFLAVLREAKLGQLGDDQFDEFLRIVLEGVTGTAAEQTIERPKLRWPERSAFSQMLFLFHRRTAASFLDMSRLGRLATRFRSFCTGLKFSRRRGTVQLHDFPRPTRLGEVDGVECPCLDVDGAAMIERYLAAKLFGKQIFGKLFYDYHFLAGFAFLMVAYAGVLWYARAAALARGVERVGTEDVARGIEYVDYGYGYSAAAASRPARVRIWTLGQRDGACRLALHYSPAATAASDSC